MSCNAKQKYQQGKKSVLLCVHNLRKRDTLRWDLMRDTRFCMRVKKGLSLVGVHRLGDLVEANFDVFSIDQENDDLTFSANAVDQAHPFEWNGIH